MNHNQTSDPGRAAPRNEEEVRQLLRDAGPRPEPPVEDLAAINAAARSAWQEMVAEKQRARFHVPTRRIFAVAASLMLALLAGWWYLRQGTAPVAGATVATIEMIHGGVELDGRRTGVAAEVRENSTLATSDAGSGVAVRMADGQSLRLDTQSVLKFLSETRVELQHGAVYIDSPPGGEAGRRVDVVTELGTVVEIGTQFEVRIDQAGAVLDVRVREGAVSVRRQGRSVTARLGESLTVRRDGSVSRGALASDGPEWAWAQSLAHAGEIEGQSLSTFLAWASRETGWEISYQSSELEASAGTIRLSGSIEGLRPDEAVKTILRASGLTYGLEEGVLQVSQP